MRVTAPRKHVGAAPSIIRPCGTPSWGYVDDVFGHGWDQAEATIVARDGKNTGDGMVTTYTYVADVRLATGETFRATVHEPTIATDFWPPNIGDVVSVLVKGKDRKVKFDKDDDRLSVKAYHAAKKAAFEAQRSPGES
jgi:hypothetical protein